MMAVRLAREWLMRYFFVASVLTGAFFLLSPGRVWLPLTFTQSMRALEILQPVLIGQLLVAYRWYAGHPGRPDSATAEVSTWLVKGPPLAAAVLLPVGLLLLATGKLGGPLSTGTSWEAVDSFTALLSFVVLLLNSSTIFIMRAIFEGQPAGNTPGS